MGALGYYFCALSCTRGYVQKVLEPTLKRLMTRFLVRYRTDSVKRQFMPRTLGGRGFRSLVDEYDSCILQMYVYFVTADDPFLTGTWALQRKLVELKRKNVFSEGKRVADRLAMDDLKLHDEHVVLNGSQVKPNDRSDLVGTFVKKHQAKKREAT